MHEIDVWYMHMKKVKINNISLFQIVNSMTLDIIVKLTIFCV